MAGSKGTLIKKRIGSILTRSPSNPGEVGTLGSPSSYATSPVTTDSESSPEMSRNVSRTGSPTPIPIPAGSPLERQRTSSSMASSFFSRLTISSPRSNPFEAYEAERRKRERKHQKTVEKRIRDFHATVTGAVFIGTVVHYPSDTPSSSTDSRSFSEDDGRNHTRHCNTYSTYKVGVANIAPRSPPPPKSAKAQHYEAFTSYYNENSTLECFFDVFMKSIPREGARVSFIVTPTGEDDEYVAVACNIIDRFTPMRVNSHDREVAASF